MPSILRRLLSVYGLMGVGIILVIEPALSQYLSLLTFWFSLGVLSLAVAVTSLRKP